MELWVLSTRCTHALIVQTQTQGAAPAYPPSLPPSSLIVRASLRGLAPAPPAAPSFHRFWHPNRVPPHYVLAAVLMLCVLALL